MKIDFAVLSEYAFAQFASEEKIAVHNPATGEFLGEVPACSAEQVQTAIAVAERAWASWREKSANERSQILRQWFDLMREHRDDLARILTLEQGKPLREAAGEIDYGASYVEWFAEEAKRVYGDTIPAPSGDKRILVIRQPVGVCAAITPWNFPNAMIARKAAPALAAGCTFLVKPASQTPFSAWALQFLAEQAGVPAGVLQVLTGSSRVIGEALTASETVRKFSFTGSTEVGSQLMQQCAPTVKKMSLELGGNAPFIVFDDADIDAAIAGALAAKFRNAGQTCVCANRLLVQEAVYDEFCRKWVDAVQRLKVGDGMAADTDIGPLINQDAIVHTEKLLQDALAKGADLATGGSADGNFFQPTVLLNATPEMSVFKEEIFAPIAPVFRFADEKEAIALANDTEFGLAAYFYSKDLSRCLRVAEALEYGMVGVNTGMISNAAAPFGGIKQSGFGREGSKYGLDDYLELKYIAIGGV